MANKEISVDIPLSNASVSGASYSGSISWSVPEIPSGAVIISCVLSGTFTYTNSKGKELSFTINGTSVDGNFSISLGTTNTTKSVSVSGSGGNKQSTGTISYSNVKYTVTYNIPGLEPPIITIISQDVTKISKVTGYDICTVRFTADKELSYWEARATTNGTMAHGTGLLVESGTLAEGAIGIVYVENEELTNGDLTYTIAIFGQSKEGVWSDDE